MEVRARTSNAYSNGRKKNRFAGSMTSRGLFWTGSSKPTAWRKAFAAIHASSCWPPGVNPFGNIFAKRQNRLVYAPLMQPKLVAIAGPLKGSVIPLTDAETIIGRDPANAVSIHDPLVSRRHCSIRGRGVAMEVSDLDSLNGTFVNGEPMKEKEFGRASCRER